MFFNYFNNIIINYKTLFNNYNIIYEMNNIKNNIINKFIHFLDYNFFIDLCYYYSIIQIYFNKVYKNIEVIINNNKFLREFKKEFNAMYFNDNINYIEIIKNGIIIRKIINDCINDYELLHINNNSEFDFFIYSYKNLDNNGIINKKIINKNMSIPYNYNTTNNYFINISLFIYNEEFNIKLRDDYYNFYVEDNIFDLNFFKYYIKNILKYDIDFDSINNLEINIKLIDKDINITSLCFYENKIENNNINYNNKIIINKNNYIIN